MSANSDNAELAGLVAELRAVASEARRDFGGLSAEQLNWKPGADAWSVGQCFEHLIKTNDEYVPMLEQIISGARKSSFMERFSPLSAFWGKFLVKALQPESTRKLKTSQKFTPSASGVGADILDRFAGLQERLVEMIEATKSMNLKRIVITSPFNSLVTYNLIDAYRGVVAHERRHAAQARRVKESAGFPRAAEG